MLKRSLVGVLAAALVLSTALSGARAFDESKYPDIEGQWKRGSPVGSWDPAKPPGRGQQAPLTPEYQAIFEANLAKQKTGQDFDPKANCEPPGMPRLMMMYMPMEIVIKPNMTYFMLESVDPLRRIFTDGRDWPKQIEPSFVGYSIGKWVDEDGDGKFDALLVETRGMKGPRLFDGNGIPFHEDNQTIVKERIYLDKTNPDVLVNEVTTIDHALTQPWTVKRQYRRERNPMWFEYVCSEDNRYVVLGGEIYLVSGDGFLMPIQKGQPAPDLKYFKPAAK
jgi:hypothetical protein